MSETPKLDPGRGYLLAYWTKMREQEALAVGLVGRFYGERAPLVIARALHIPSNDRHREPLSGVFALLHRLIEETDASVEDLRAGGLSEDTVALLDAVSPRTGETPRQTALRAVCDPRAARLITGHGGGMVLFVAPSKPGTWWATDPDAWKVLEADAQRRDELDEQAEAQVTYHYTLPGAELQAAGVPPAWANALRETFKAFTDPQFTRRGLRQATRVSYDRHRVVRLNAGRHLVAVFQAGITPEQYEQYVASTQLTWTQIPAWQAAGLSPQLAAQVDIQYGRNPQAARAAVELTGDERRCRELFDWARQTVAAEEYPERPLGRALSWSAWRDDERNTLDSPERVAAAWSHLVAQSGSVQAAQRALDLRRVIPIPRTSTPQGRVTRNRAAYPELLSRWDATGLSLARIELLLGAGVMSPEEALAEDTRALSDAQLRMAASMSAAGRA